MPMSKLIERHGCLDNSIFELHVEQTFLYCYIYFIKRHFDFFYCLHFSKPSLFVKILKTRRSFWVVEKNEEKIDYVWKGLTNL